MWASLSSWQVGATLGCRGWASHCSGLSVERGRLSHRGEWGPLLAAGGGLLIAVASLWSAGFSLIVVSGGHSWLQGGLLIALASLWSAGSSVHGLLWLQPVASGVVSRGLQSTGAIVVAHGLHFSLAHGFFLDQGLNLCLRRWWAASLTLSHQGSPTITSKVHLKPSSSHPLCSLLRGNQDPELYV